MYTGMEQIKGDELITELRFLAKLSFEEVTYSALTALEQKWAMFLIQIQWLTWRVDTTEPVDNKRFSLWPLWTQCQCRHQELHFVNKVSSFHSAPVYFFIRPPQVTPFSVLHHVTLGQLFCLTARKLNQDLTAALWTVPHCRQSSGDVLLFVVIKRITRRT